MVQKFIPKVENFEMEMPSGCTECPSFENMGYASEASLSIGSGRLIDICTTIANPATVPGARPIRPRNGLDRNYIAIEMPPDSTDQGEEDRSVHLGLSGRRFSFPSIIPRRNMLQSPSSDFNRILVREIIDTLREQSRGPVNEGGQTENVPCLDKILAITIVIGIFGIYILVVLIASRQI